jgi:hypothetical protein
LLLGREAQEQLDALQKYWNKINKSVKCAFWIYYVRWGRLVLTMIFGLLLRKKRFGTLLLHRNS